MNVFAIIWCILMFVVLPIAAMVHEHRIRNVEPEGIPEEALTYRSPPYLALQDKRAVTVCEEEAA